MSFIRNLFFPRSTRHPAQRAFASALDAGSSFGAESGRSMVEMLGVLAIIGVLTIVGFVGYQYAITKSKANDTVDELNKRYTVYVVQAERGGLVDGATLLSNDFGGTTRLGYPAQARLLDRDNRVFEITLNDVPVKVCKQILNDYSNIPYEVTVGGAETAYAGDVAICGEEANELIRMTFVYDPYNTGVPGGVPMGGDNNECTTDFDCNAGYVCDNGTCIQYVPPECVQDEDCAGVQVCENKKCVMPPCTSDADCGANQKCENEKCVIKCLASEIEYNGVCYACNADVVLPVSAAECAKCPAERQYTAHNTCILKNSDCPEGFRDTSNKCQLCTDPSKTIKSTAAECGKCLDLRYHNGTYCFPACSEGQFAHTNGTCYPCSNTAAYAASAEQCARCGDERFFDGGYCRLSCPAGQFKGKNLSTGGEECYTCTNTGAITSIEGQCDLCSDKRYYSGGKCYSKCPGGFLSTSGYCYPCSNTAAYAASAEECARCGDERFFDGGYCRLSCPAGQFRDTSVSQGACQSCKDTMVRTVSSGANECGRCPDDRYLEGTKCFSKCPGGFLNTSGNCYLCSVTSTTLKTTAEECARCANRTFDGTYCKLS